MLATGLVSFLLFGGLATNRGLGGAEARAVDVDVEAEVRNTRAGGGGDGHAPLIMQQQYGLPDIDLEELDFDDYEDEFTGDDFEDDRPQTVVVATPLDLDADTPDSDPDSDSKPRRLTGRFLHLTDMHPDPFYRTGGTESSACHRKKPKKKKKAHGGEFGLPFGECDSPMVLTNHTLDFLEKHWAKEVDFVIWTGDSARHDNDREHPRTPDEIYMLNRAMVKRMDEVFTSRGIPVVPCIGNNDVWPHNIMAAGEQLGLFRCCFHCGSVHFL